jgi:hypothetical protein
LQDGALPVQLRIGTIGESIEFEGVSLGTWPLLEVTYAGPESPEPQYTPPLPELLRAFLALDARSSQCVEEFARTWGAIGICVHGRLAVACVICRMVFWRTYAYPTYKRRAGNPLMSFGQPVVDKPSEPHEREQPLYEPVMAWQHLQDRVRLILRGGYDWSNGGLGDSDVLTVNSEIDWLHRAARLKLIRLAGEERGPVDVEMTDPGDDWEPTTAGLLGHLVRQTIEAMRQTERLYRCGICGDVVPPAVRLPRSGRVPLCASRACKEGQHRRISRESARRRVTAANDSRIDKQPYGHNATDA